MWTIYQVGSRAAASIALCAGLLIEVAAAQTPTTGCNPTDTKTVSCTQTTSKTTVDSTGTPKTVTQQTAVTTPYGTTSWQGLNWGIGIAADFDLGGKRVTGAVIDTAPGGNIVRVTDTSGNVGVSFVLGSALFFERVASAAQVCGPQLQRIRTRSFCCHRSRRRCIRNAQYWTNYGIRAGIDGGFAPSHYRSQAR